MKNSCSMPEVLACATDRRGEIRQLVKEFLIVFKIADV